MSISAIPGSQSLSAVHQMSQSLQGNGAMRKAFEAAAKALDMNAEELRGALRSGQTMSQLAQSKGIGTDTLTSAISSALTGADSSLSSGQAQQIAQSMVAGPPPPPPGGQGGGGPGGGQGLNQDVKTALDAVASALNLSSDQLRSQLESGQNLTSVASANGMNTATLKATITQAISAADTALSTDQVSSVADKIIQGPPPRPEHDKTPRLGFDLSMNASGTTGVTSMSQQALDALYRQSAQASTVSQTWI